MIKHFRIYFQVSSIIILIALIWVSLWSPGFWWGVAIVTPIIIKGWHDALQTRDNVMRNYPLFGSFKKTYISERHLFVQEFLESNKEGMPFNWVERNIVYARASSTLMSTPFGTELDYNQPGYSWWLHSVSPLPSTEEDLRLTIGNSDCCQPYNASILNVSAMSYGSISRNAVLALGEGAKMGNFALNTGEGGLTEWHLQPGCDLIFQFGTGYFGCRTPDGNFDPDRFRELAVRPEVKMIEIKISQGAKPGYGAILPASKNTEEIAAIRGLEPFTTIHSPGAHTAFNTPAGLLEFVKQLRELSGGKPVGFKLCLGLKHEFVAICKAMQETGIRPDYIAIDGGEGGTGAADFDSIHYVGSPIEPALAFVHDVLTGFDLRKHIRLLGSGKIISAFDVVRFLALGADAVYSARAMMFALGCTQALKCNTNECPTGVTAMEPSLVKGLVVSDKKVRVANYHRNTVQGVKNMLASAGLSHMGQIRRGHIQLRTKPEQVVTLEDIYPSLQPGVLLQTPYPEKYRPMMEMADASTFAIKSAK